MENRDTASTYEKAATAALEPYTAAFSGDVCAQVLCVVDTPQGEAPCSPACREALGKSLEALGYDVGSLAFARIGALPQSLSLVGLIEAADPVLIVSLEEKTTHELCVAYDVPDKVDTLRGRTFIALDDFEAALRNEEAKRRAWHELKRGARKKKL